MDQASVELLVLTQEVAVEPQIGQVRQVVPVGLV